MKKLKEGIKGIYISIHAPPRGATYNGAFGASSFVFQFTPLREGRHNVADVCSELENFNSRPSARGDFSFFSFFSSLRKISIHAPPRGATAKMQVIQRLKYFNSRPSARGDVNRRTLPRRRNRFQFTPLREGRLVYSCCLLLSCMISIHAPPRGATRCSAPSAHCRRCHFNSRPSARGDGKRYAISANLLFNPYKSAWLNNSATQFVEIILVIFHRIIA